jgi:hypothetical protein
MNQADFEIEVALWALTMTALVVPNAETRGEGGVTLEREEVRKARPVRPRKTQAAGVAVEKRMTGRLSKAKEIREAPSKASPAR